MVVPNVFVFSYAAQRLAIYNGALIECGERKLARLDEPRESARTCDEIWNNRFVDDVLGQGQWTFAMRTVKLDHDPNVTTQFGHRFAFAQPEDYIRLIAISADENLSEPLLNYEIEAGFWYTDVDPLYLRYISSDDAYGGDLSKWTPDFTRFVELYLALRIAPRLTGSKADREQIKKDLRIARTEARSSEAMEKPPGFMPRGSWVRSRSAGRSNGDRGSRSRLIG